MSNTARCRSCGSVMNTQVLDLGWVPAADHFPPQTLPPDRDGPGHHLTMFLCTECGLAQLGPDDTTAEEPRGIEPQALRDQAANAVAVLADGGWLRGHTVREFPSPHGGSWLSLLSPPLRIIDTGRADLVVDSFGIMHDRDQRAAFECRADSLTYDGVLALQFHSLSAILRLGQWNSLRHGHYAYYSLTSIRHLLAVVGLRIRSIWQFSLYGGTTLVTASRVRQGARDTEPPVLDRILAAEDRIGVRDPGALQTLQVHADTQVNQLRKYLDEAADQGLSVYAYGAASRCVALLAAAHVNSIQLRGIADASPAKHGRRIPWTDIPIIAPEDLVAADPDVVLVTLPELCHEVSATYPSLRERLVQGVL